PYTSPMPPCACPLSLHDALPISRRPGAPHAAGSFGRSGPAEPVPIWRFLSCQPVARWRSVDHHGPGPINSLFGLSFETVTALCRSEEHTSELQSRGHLVCRLLLE